MNGNFDFVFEGLNRFQMVSLARIRNSSLQKIVQRGQITALRRPIEIKISADYSIFENGAQKIDYYVGCVASGLVFLKHNVVHVILFNFLKQKFVAHSMVTVAIDRNGRSLLIFEKNDPMKPPHQNTHQTVTCCECIDFSMMTIGFYKLQVRQFCLLTLLTFCPNNRKYTERLG